MKKRKHVLAAVILLLAMLTVNVASVSAGSLLSGIGSLMNTFSGDEELPEVMTIFISGIDTRSDHMEEKSLSDVNIIATLNTRTKELMLLNTPRDYFVPLSISNGVPDKLTHAGSYGIGVCVDTMEMLYDIKIDYYLRFNFAGFVKIIDTLGGITVYSDYEFDSQNELGYHFVEGDNEMDGQMALVFSRERYAFSEGDRQRGKNQIHVIEGVINKLKDMNLLTSIDPLLDSAKGCYETTMSKGQIISLALQEVSYLNDYTVTTYSVDGTGATEKPYSMNEKAYVMIPDQSTVEEAKRLMKEVREAE
ncbi:MAG: LCP family protein [Clostridiales bacterium]|nr:LCP family protein [Candidatus Blautia equi]